MPNASKLVTYSPAYTLVPTYECFNRCTYCNFRLNPGEDSWLTLEAAEEILRSLHAHSLSLGQTVIEILILSGEVHPKSVRRSAWIQHIYELCDLALSFGFLPHTNVGPLSFEEMQQLKSVNVSMGLMLEQMTPSLLETVHRNAPSKSPALRRQQLEWAGELQIPFTTGLLMGIGETEADRVDTLETIAQIHQQWGHLQEVILQPYSPGTHEKLGSSAFDAADLVRMVEVARAILPDEIAIQVPPNLIRPDVLLACLEAGARDLGGIGPKDEVNPNYPHPLYTELQQTLKDTSWKLVPRLPVYPQFVAWLPERLKAATQSWQSQLLSVSSVAAC